jgi:O-antigen ligase
LRRTLLVLVTGLLVARPVIPGEAPGLISDLEGPGGLSLTLLWLLACVGWASWRLWTGIGDFRFGQVEFGLFALAGLVFLSAGMAATYKFPAWLTAWEWLGLALAFFLVRQLAAGPEEQHGLYCALLAGAVALSITSFYQAAVEIPRIFKEQEHVFGPEGLAASLRNRLIAVSETELEQLHRRILNGDVFATFTWPSSFAAHLALLLPGLAGAAVASYRSGASGRQTVAAVLGAAMVAVALFLTHSVPAMLAVTLIGAVILIESRIRPGWERPAAMLAVLAVLIGGGYLLTRAGVFDQGVIREAYEGRIDTWSAAWRMIESQPWLGVGPGNFAMTYPSFMTERSWEKAREPHNFILEVWSNFGLFATVALVVALGIFFWRVARWWNTAEAPPVRRPDLGAEKDSAGKPAATTIGWEYYLGGMFGILLGFVLRASQLPAGALLDEAISAGVRSLVWFAAFGLLERIAWTDRERVAALTAGAAACLLCLLVGDGIGFPSVAGPFWVVVALGLAIVSPAPQAWLSRQQPLLFAPVPIFVGAALAYGLFIFLPVVNSASVTAVAVNNRQVFYREMQKPPRERDLKPADPIQNLVERVAGPLVKAEEEARVIGKGNARIRIQLGATYADIWDRDHRDTTASRAISWLVLAQDINPKDLTAYLLELKFRQRAVDLYIVGKAGNLCELLASPVSPWFKLRPIHDDEYHRREAYFDAQISQQRAVIADVLQRCVQLDPTDAPLRHALAKALREAGRIDASREQAREAVRLDRLSTHRLRRLTDRQREQALRWSLAEKKKGGG